MEKRIESTGARCLPLAHPLFVARLLDCVCIRGRQTRKKRRLFKKITQSKPGLNWTRISSLVLQSLLPFFVFRDSLLFSFLMKLFHLPFLTFNDYVCLDGRTSKVNQEMPWRMGLHSCFLTWFYFFEWRLSFKYLSSSSTSFSLNIRLSNHSLAGLLPPLTIDNNNVTFPTQEAFFFQETHDWMLRFMSFLW